MPRVQCPWGFKGKSDVQLMEHGPTFSAGFALVIELGITHTTMAPFVIYPSRSRVFLILFGSVTFVAAGALMLLLPLNEIGITGKIVALLGVAFFGKTGLFAITRLISNKPALAIDSGGITDHASALSVGFIPWSDIIGAGICTFQKQKFLGISLRNPEEYLAKTSAFKRILMKTNSSWVGYVVVIPQVTISMPVEDLLVHVDKYRHMDGRIPND
ncbi:STM3941 family protein [Rhodoferax mekongensis]|uniref:STM3941 family protein n=1 Tax=Rhodoferax mekongensis TaxID=3068341 RepID=UPI0028BD9A06|nr:STM3941 family protein [Rhodoferax sp. TBRC 17199]MDT7515316.1 STM3941 family protein [Rhodoferax sp. TBRC 17199]